MKTYSTHAGP